MPNDYYDHLNIDGDERPLRDPDAQEQLFYALFKYPAIAYCNAMFRPELDANNNLFLMPDSTDVGTFSFTADAAVVIITFERTLNIYYNKGNKIGFTENNERYMYPIYVNQNQNSAGYIYAGGTFLLIWHRTGTLASGKPDGYFLIGDLQDARGVPYDNTQSALQAATVNDAIDELDLIKANEASLATVATSGDYRDLSNKPTIPAAQVNSDWNASSGVAEILNKPDLSYLENVAWYDETHEFDPSGSYQKGDTCIYNEKLYRCDVNQATPGAFVPLEWSEVNARTLSGDFSNLWDIADQLYTGKQDKLTAGQNVSINANNEISATDTKPSNLTNVVPASAAAVPTGGTWTKLEKINLPVGKLCLVTVHAQYENNTTGYRSVGIGGEGGTATIPLGAHYQLTLPPPNGAAANLVLTVFFVPETGVNYYIITRHTMGSTKNCTYRYRYVSLN